MKFLHLIDYEIDVRRKRKKRISFKPVWRLFHPTLSIFLCIQPLSLFYGAHEQLPEKNRFRTEDLPLIAMCDPLYLHVHWHRDKMRRVKWKELSLLPLFYLCHFFALLKRCFFWNHFRFVYFLFHLFSVIYACITAGHGSFALACLSIPYTKEKRRHTVKQTDRHDWKKRVRHVNKLNRFEMDCVTLNNTIS